MGRRKHIEESRVGPKRKVGKKEERSGRRETFLGGVRGNGSGGYSYLGKGGG